MPGNSLRNSMKGLGSAMRSDACVGEFVARRDSGEGVGSALRLPLFCQKTFSLFDVWKAFGFLRGSCFVDSGDSRLAGTDTIEDEDVSEVMSMISGYAVDWEADFERDVDGTAVLVLPKPDVENEGRFDSGFALEVTLRTGLNLDDFEGSKRTYEHCTETGHTLDMVATAGLVVVDSGGRRKDARRLFELRERRPARAADTRRAFAITCIPARRLASLLSTTNAQQSCQQYLSPPAAPPLAFAYGANRQGLLVPSYQER